jgi:DNA-binding beta-propeller fold protein YncE
MANGQFNNPTGIVVDASGNVYVSDSSNNRIEKFNSSGGFITSWGTPGPGNGQFNIPGHLALDSTGNVYVADTFNNRVQEFAGNGTFLTSFGVMGSGNGQLVDPNGLALDSSGNVYVVDTGNSVGTNNNRIEVFSPVATGSFPASCAGSHTHPM